MISVSRGSQKPKFLKECMDVNYNFQRGAGLKPENRPYVGEVWILIWNTHEVTVAM